MKKEITFVITLGLFLLAYALDYFAGNLNIIVASPIYFLSENYFKLYPMTFVAVIVRSTAIMLSVTLLLSVIDRQYFKKMTIALFLAFVAEIYSFQILATNSNITPLLWTLAISYAGALLVIPIIVYIVLGIADFLIPHKNTVSLPKTENTPSDTSVLNP